MQWKYLMLLKNTELGIKSIGKREKYITKIAFNTWTNKLASQTHCHLKTFRYEIKQCHACILPFSLNK